MADAEFNEKTKGEKLMKQIKYSQIWKQIGELWDNINAQSLSGSIDIDLSSISCFFHETTPFFALS